MITSVTNYILLIGTAVFLVSIGCMITPSVSAQGITRVSKLPSGPEIGLDDQPTSSKDNGEDSEEEDSETTDDDQITDDDTEENQTTGQDNETKSEDQPKATTPRKEVEGGLGDIVNETQFTVPPPYHMKIIFNFMLWNDDHEGALSGCGEYDLTVYVQGKKLSLTDAAGGKNGMLWDICEPQSGGFFKPGTAEVTLDIPDEDPQDPTDSQPLSIFTVGTEIDGCMRATLPSNLKEVQDVLSDKGTTRPYYAGVKEKIAKIQSDINSNLPRAGCIGSPSLHNDNDLLGVINEVYYPPAYGKHRGTFGQTNSTGPEIGVNYAISSTGDFQLEWLIDCPLCATLREH
jgi:hypothetical protein